MTQSRWKGGLGNKFQTGKSLWGDLWGQLQSLLQIPQREKEGPKGPGVGSVGQACPSLNKAALMCFPAGWRRNAGPCSLLQPLGSYKHPSPKGRSITETSSFLLHHMTSTFLSLSPGKPNTSFISSKHPTRSQPGKWNWYKMLFPVFQETLPS